MLILSIYQLIIFVLFSFVITPHVYAETTVRINEFLVHPSVGNKEWVEFYNPDTTDIETYWIDDDTDFSIDNGNSVKKNLADLQKGNEAYYSFIEVNSLFNNAEDSVVLFDGSGAIVDHYSYTKDPGTDKTIGRVDGTGDFQVLIEITKGGKNGGPLPTNTSTPSPTTRPTNVPTATKSLTPTKVPTGTKKQTDINDVSPILATSVKINARSPVVPKAKAASMSGVPTSILGTKSAEKKPILKNKNMLVKEANNSLFPIHAILISIGGIFIIGCGILMYLRMRKS